MAKYVWKMDIFWFRLDASLPLLSQLLKMTVDFHRPSRRIFVGNVFMRFTAEFKNEISRLWS